MLNTGGIDTGNALGINESENWRPIGTTGYTYPRGTGITSGSVLSAAVLAALDDPSTLADLTVHRAKKDGRVGG